MKSLLSAALAASLALPSVALAQEGADKAAKDPGRLICKSQEQTGTRIARKKQCMTAVQWKEQRRLSRMEIDRSQSNRFRSQPDSGT